MRTKTKENVLEGIIAGDTATIKAFYKRNWMVILEFVYNNGGTEQEAEDVFQDALVCLYQKGKTDALLMTKASIHTYFYNICKNLWFSQLRERRVRNNSQDFIKLQQKNTDIALQEEQEWMEERRHLLYAYLEQLSETGKQLMELVALGLRMEDIATRMGYSERYTRKKKFHIKKKLLKKLQKDHRYWELAG